jgi:hypothetical protein
MYKAEEYQRHMTTCTTAMFSWPEGSAWLKGELYALCCKQLLAFAVAAVWCHVFLTPRMVIAHDQVHWLAIGYCTRHRLIWHATLCCYQAVPNPGAVQLVVVLLLLLLLLLMLLLYMVVSNAST